MPLVINSLEYGYTYTHKHMHNNFLDEKQLYANT